MPIYFSKETKEWYLKDMDQEELDFLIRLGKEQFLRSLSLALVQRFMPAQEQEELAQQDFLDRVDPKNMGQA